MGHIHEKIDWTVEIFIVHKDRVLLRKHDKYHIWLGVGGHIELDEDPIQAAKRECLEEVGLAVTIHNEHTYSDIGDKRINIPSPAFMNRHPISDVHEHIALVYFATADTTMVTPESDTDRWKWLSKDAVTNDTTITEEIKRYALAALETLKA